MFNYLSMHILVELVVSMVIPFVLAQFNAQSEIFENFLMLETIVAVAVVNHAYFIYIF